MSILLLLPRTNSKAQSSLNFLQSGPPKFTKSAFSGLAPIRRVLISIRDKFLHRGFPWSSIPWSFCFLAFLCLDIFLGRFVVFPCFFWFSLVFFFLGVFVFPCCFFPWFFWFPCFFCVVIFQNVWGLLPGHFLCSLLAYMFVLVVFQYIVLSVILGGFLVGATKKANKLQARRPCREIKNSSCGECKQRRSSNQGWSLAQWAMQGNDSSCGGCKQKRSTSQSWSVACSGPRQQGNGSSCRGCKPRSSARQLKSGAIILLVVGANKGGQPAKAEVWPRRVS